MARRAGKAASRKSRQRRVQRPTPPIGAPPPAAGTDFLEADPRSATTAPPPRPRSTGLLAGSTLTATERAEYHYVERDLRNIGILTVVMAGLLILAWAIFSATGLVG
jgi:hypothetical protein